MKCLSVLNKRMYKTKYYRFRKLVENKNHEQQFTPEISEQPAD